MSSTTVYLNDKFSAGLYKSSTSDYPDRWVIFLAAIFFSHFINVLGRDELFFELLTQGFYYRDMFFSSLIFWTSLQVLSRATQQLDKQYDWFSKPGHRLLLQLIFGWMLPAAIGMILCLPYWRYIIKEDITEATFFLYEFPVILVLLAGCNLMYLGYYIFLKWKEEKSKSRKLELQLSQFQSISANIDEAKSTLLVKRGEKVYPLIIKQVAYFFKEKDCVFAHTFNGETILLDFSLDELGKMLCPEQFFRSNRQTIVSFFACKYFKNSQHGKLELQLELGKHESIIVSQKKAKAFKIWLNR